MNAILWLQSTIKKHTSGQPQDERWLSVNGAANVVSQAGSVWAYGNYPAYNYLPTAGTAADVNDGTIIYEQADSSIFNHHEFSIVVAPGLNSVQVLVSYDGTTYEATPIEVFDRSLVEGAVVQSLAQITAIGNYYFNGVFKKWKLVNNGATTGAKTQMRGGSSRI